MRSAKMLRIEKAINGRISFSLSGHMEAADIEELRRLFGLEPAVKGIVLNLKQLVLADGDAVEFLAESEAASMTLVECPPYVRKWIDHQKAPQ
jgi:hypothetical protein